MSILALGVFQAVRSTLYMDGKRRAKIVTFLLLGAFCRSCRSHLSYRQVGSWCHRQLIHSAWLAVTDRPLGSDLWGSNRSQARPVLSIDFSTLPSHLPDPLSFPPSHLSRLIPHLLFHFINFILPRPALLCLTPHLSLSLPPHQSTLRQGGGGRGGPQF